MSVFGDQTSYLCQNDEEVSPKFVKGRNMLITFQFLFEVDKYFFCQMIFFIIYMIILIYLISKWNFLINETKCYE
jgi:hypothetical protein